MTAMHNDQLRWTSVVHSLDCTHTPTFTAALRWIQSSQISCARKHVRALHILKRSQARARAPQLMTMHSKSVYASVSDWRQSCLSRARAIARTRGVLSRCSHTTECALAHKMSTKSQNRGWLCALRCERANWIIQFCLIAMLVLIANSK